MSDLQDFVLKYFQAAGGIIEPPAYDIYEALLPETVARKLGIEAFQRVTFTDDAADDATHLTYNHPIVEQMIKSAWETPSRARFYINEVRLDKHGLAELAQKTFSFPNARLYAAPQATEERALFHYLQINFKAALITDEKRERFVSVWIDAQGGHAVEGLATQTHLPLESKPRLKNLPVAPLRWLPGHDLSSREALAGLFDRAAQAAIRQLAAATERLQTRASRYLELDRARLEQYYADIEADLKRRLQRSSDEARQASLQGKLEAAQADHLAKLADVEAKYRLRIELDPINAAIIAQPKIRLQVQVKNRHTTATRTVVWDPFRRVLEPLTCHVCLRARTTLSLCDSGHLVCDAPECQAPQCVDCKRIYCRHCADQLTTCVVCDRPVCQHSLNSCPECGRGACREHVNLCHAADGEPQKIVAPPPTPKPEPPPPKPKPKKAAHKPKKKRPKPPLPKPRPAPRYSNLRLEVQIYTNEPDIAAFVHKSGDRQVARRIWSLEEGGIAVYCDCEKRVDCPAGDMIFMPAFSARIEEQLEAEIEKVRSEYNIAPKRIKHFVGADHSGFKRIHKLTLRGPWKDEKKLSAARAAFLDRYHSH